jgi:S-ribosylhomocysteine lyase
VFGSPDETSVGDGIRRVLAKVAAWDDAEAVPGVDPVMCGNWKDHDLASAKFWAARWIAETDAKGGGAKGYACF